jgi:hypothetical protein
VFQEILLRKYIARYVDATEAIDVVTAAYVKSAIRSDTELFYGSGATRNYHLAKSSRVAFTVSACVQKIVVPRTHC